MPFPASGKINISNTKTDDSREEPLVFFYRELRIEKGKKRPTD